MKIEGATPEDIFEQLFDIGARKFLSEKEKRHIHDLFEKQDLEHLELDEDFDDYLDNDGFEGIVGDKGIQNLNMDGYFYLY